MQVGAIDVLDALVPGTDQVELVSDRHVAGIYGVQTLDDGQALIDGLAEKPRKVVVVGSGYVGLEIAEACVARGFDTTVIDRSKAPLSIIEPQLGEQIAAAMRKHGIRLLSDTAVMRPRPV